MSNDEEELIYRKPQAKDGTGVWQLIKDAGTLDVNSPYCYMLLCDQFADTCVVAESEGKQVGYVSAFITPSDPQTLFVWQIAVAPSQRGKGVALTMLKSLLKRKACSNLRHITLTIGPSNLASQNLFKRLAEQLGTRFEISKGYPAAWFPEDNHEEEMMVRIGPLA